MPRAWVTSSAAVRSSAAVSGITAGSRPSRTRTQYDPSADAPSSTAMPKGSVSPEMARKTC